MNVQMIDQEEIEHPAEGNNREQEENGELSPTEEEKKSKARKVKWTIFGIVIGLAIIAVIMILFGRDLLSGLEGAGDWLQENKVWGVVILSLSAAITCNLSAVIPIVYATSLLLAGYTHGYAALAYTMISTIIGSTAGFIMVNVCFKERIGRWLEKSKQLHSYKRAIGKGGTRIVILIRSVPGPYGLITFMLGVCDVTVPQFMLASVFGVMRQILHVSIGASVKDLQDIFNGKAVPKVATFVVAGVAVVLALITAYWARKLVAQEIAESGDETHVQVLDPTGSQTDVPLTQDVPMDDIEMIPTDIIDVQSPTDVTTHCEKYTRESV
eukprot:TRINITY_DN7732_c0_g1_i1.p1 TRINITY_DN7732_c0_g1~~TRINITY_DN7732_c0_g1_i1.p1  ORF type:complete len:326 (+),score=59.98 TRINITY_DN7732_c0_g1_i1:44-1021(+)